MVAVVKPGPGKLCFPAKLISHYHAWPQWTTLMDSLLSCTQSIFWQTQSYVDQQRAFFATLPGKKTDLRQLPDAFFYNPPLPGRWSCVLMSPGQTGGGG
ncbi:hypothetical protein JZM24_08565 [Candidatus Sodalis endolongispinus]|uniref:Uncharacterized protein n=1 Tax=Candidatus Sodalis endolongispinus TaxID=2812662 RepID=A0ABS5YC93_9GAMM|nr:hypothetical protein [Candidatus Sodalis endolongispinus]MBT9432165.1 hypothetical protein [Candidatus Sodalis endolongispinus]